MYGTYIQCTLTNASTFDYVAAVRSDPHPGDDGAAGLHGLPREPLARLGLPEPPVQAAREQARSQERE